MNIETINKKIFSELGREKQLVVYHDIIYKLLGVVIDFINAEGESLKLSKMRHFSAYCTMFRRTASGFAACRECDRKHARHANFKRGIIIYECHAGLTELVLPLYDNKGRYIGGLTSGQFRLENAEPVIAEAIGEIALRHGLEPVLMQELYRQTKILSPEQLEGIIEYLRAVGRFIVETHNRILFMELIDAPAKIPLIKKFVEENYMKKLTVAQTAKKFFLSPGYFSHFFKKETGISFMVYVNMYRISQAEKILQDTRINISETAFLTGFGSLSQFNRTFKGIRGISPREFRCRRC
ncbi:MAG: PocR ligand-binding domain-containing protein [Victivallales bacterium]|nr:PocR ligand-binding domain-containing protein [Victivallales bacterium]